MPVKKLQKNNLAGKLLAIVGPTSSGKSELAVKMAKKFNGEIISCDSRQIYKGMDIGTGKVEGKWIKNKFVYKSVPHYCIDYVNPKTQYSVSRFQKDAQKAIKDIYSRGKLPILCGGTGQWVDAVITDQKIPEVKPNLKLRKELEQLPVTELFAKLKKLDPHRASTIDGHNPRRLVRALEIVITTGKPVPQLETKQNYNVEWIGIFPGQEVLFKKIERRLKQRIKQGMEKEITRLHKQGLSWKKLESFGLEYKYLSLYLQKKLTKQEMFDQLLLAHKHYAKRQMTWFKRNKNIRWIT